MRRVRRSSPRPRSQSTPPKPVFAASRILSAPPTPRVTAPFSDTNIRPVARGARRARSSGARRGARSAIERTPVASCAECSVENARREIRSHGSHRVGGRGGSAAAASRRHPASAARARGGSGQRRSALRRQLRVLSRPRRDRRRERSRPHRLARSSRRTSTATRSMPVVKSGRPEKGMPPFAALPDADITQDRRLHPQAQDRRRRQARSPPQGERRGPVHRQRRERARLLRRRRWLRDVSLADRRSQRASRPKYRGLALMQRMLYPTAADAVAPADGEKRKRARVDGNGARCRRARRSAARSRIATSSTIAVTDAAGTYHSWPASDVKVTVKDPLQAHADLLPQVHRCRHPQPRRVPPDAQVGRAARPRALRPARIRGLCARLAQGLDPASLLKPAKDSWPTYHGDYSGRRNSPLTQITPDNVKNLGLAWAFQTGPARSDQGEPDRRRRRDVRDDAGSRLGDRRAHAAASCGTTPIRRTRRSTSGIAASPSTRTSST